MLQHKKHKINIMVHYNAKLLIFLIYNLVISLRINHAYILQPQFQLPKLSRTALLANVAIETGIVLSTLALSAIPVSILLDKVAQNGTQRISTIANTKFTDEYGDFFAYVAKPESKLGFHFPVIILVHQFFGLRQREVELCDELASIGYIAVAPDCYQGNTTGLVPRAISLVSPIVFSENYDLQIRDIGRVLSYVTKMDFADNDRIAVAGFCFGGGVAVRAGDSFPDKIKAVGIFYGKPLNSIKNLSCPVYCVFGGRDQQFPPKIVDEFETLLSTKRIPHTIKRYPTQGHAFITDLAATRDQEDAKDAWQGFLSFLERSLK